MVIPHLICGPLKCIPSLRYYCTDLLATEFQYPMWQCGLVAPWLGSAPSVHGKIQGSRLNCRRETTRCAASLWSPYGIGHTIIFSCCSMFFLLFFFPLKSSPNLCHTSTHGMGLSANLRRRSETCCTRLAENTGRKKVAKNRHLGTIPQLCRAISSQLRNVSIIGKKLLSSNMSSTWPHNTVNFGPYGYDRFTSLGHPCKFQRLFLATSLHGSQV